MVFLADSNQNARKNPLKYSILHIVAFFSLFWNGHILIAQIKNPESQSAKGSSHVVDSTFVEKPRAKIKVRPHFSMDNRNTVIQATLTDMYGVKAGVEFWRIRIGVGFYFLLQSPFRTWEFEHPVYGPTPVKSKLRFNYFTIFGELVLLHNHRWEISAPTNIGVGNARLFLYNDPGVITPWRRKTFFLIEPAITAHFKLLPWIGLGAGLGYRKIISNQKMVTETFDGAVVIFKIKMFLGEIYQCVRKDKSNCHGLFNFRLKPEYHQQHIERKRLEREEKRLKEQEKIKEQLREKEQQEKEKDQGQGGQGKDE